MASLRDIRKRISSIKSTRQITKAMKMVAAAKLRRATDAAISARPYSLKLQGMVGQLAAQLGDTTHPLLEQPKDVTHTLVILCASDRGLCGSYNSHLQKAAAAFIEDRAPMGPVSVIAIGKKAVGFCKRQGYNVVESIIDVPPARYYEQAAQLASRATTEFLGGKYGSVWVAYQEFVSALNQVPRVKNILPIPLEVSEADAPTLDYIYEPGQADLLGMLLPRLIENRLHKALLEANASEQASRMMAMDNATRNASELINKLTLQYNQARQAAITTELVEIVSGAEAL